MLRRQVSASEAGAPPWPDPGSAPGHRYFVYDKLTQIDLLKQSMSGCINGTQIHPYHSGSSSKFRHVWLPWPHCRRLIRLLNFLQVKRAGKQKINQSVFLHIGRNDRWYSLYWQNHAFHLDLYITGTIFVQKTGKWFVSFVMKKMGLSVMSNRYEISSRNW